jgi:hypothetical protein
MKFFLLLCGLALMIAGGFGIYNLGTSGENIRFTEYLPPCFETIAGALLVKVSTDIGWI